MRCCVFVAVIVVVVAIGIVQTVETFGGVEIKLITTNRVIQAEKVFDFLQFRPRVPNQLICLNRSRMGVDLKKR